VRFERRYEALYGSLPPAGAPEVVSWRLTAWLPRPVQAPLAPMGWPLDGRSGAPNSRMAWFDKAGWVEAAVVRHSELRSGTELHGPAIIHQAESTIVIGPEDAARIDDFGNCWITLGG
jgi:N-methylhydantoinase A